MSGVLAGRSKMSTVIWLLVALCVRLGGEFSSVDSLENWSPA